MHAVNARSDAARSWWATVHKSTPAGVVVDFFASWRTTAC